MWGRGCRLSGLKLAKKLHDPLPSLFSLSLFNNPIEPTLGKLMAIRFTKPFQLAHEPSAVEKMGEGLIPFHLSL
jgi:hypothetical protein